MASKDPAQFLPSSIEKSYFMLSRSARTVLDTALQKYRIGRTDLIPVGGIDQLKPALQLMTAYRLVIQEVTGTEVVTSYTRWLECVQVKEGPEPELYVAFSPRFERIWLASRKHLSDYMGQKPANAALRSTKFSYVRQPSFAMFDEIVSAIAERWAISARMCACW